METCAGLSKNDSKLCKVLRRCAMNKENVGAKTKTWTVLIMINFILKLIFFAENNRDFSWVKFQATGIFLGLVWTYLSNSPHPSPRHFSGLIPGMGHLPGPGQPQGIWHPHDFCTTGIEQFVYIRTSSSLLYLSTSPGEIRYILIILILFQITLNFCQVPDAPQFLQKWLPVVLLIYKESAVGFSTPSFFSEAQNGQFAIRDVWPCSNKILRLNKKCSICLTLGECAPKSLDKVCVYLLDVNMYPLFLTRHILWLDSQCFLWLCFPVSDTEKHVEQRRHSIQPVPAVFATTDRHGRSNKRLNLWVILVNWLYDTATL